MPLQYLLGPVGDMYCFSNTFRMLVYQDMILCLDGGGIRGLVLITMLQFIEEKSGRQIKNVFNFYGGTSTGGILALAFGLKENELKDRLERSLQRKKITHQHLGKANIYRAKKRKHPLTLNYYNSLSSLWIFRKVSTSAINSVLTSKSYCMHHTVSAFCVNVIRSFKVSRGQIQKSQLNIE